MKQTKISLKGIALFQGLTEKELDAIRPCLREKKFSKGEILFAESAVCERIFIVVHGRVKIYRTSSQGREQILEILSDGDTCACNPGSLEWQCGSSAQAATDCTVLYLSREDYVRMVQMNSTLARTLNTLFANRLRCFSNLIEEVSLKDAKKRLIKFLLDMLAENKLKPGKSDVLFIPFTREEIAQRLGTARETVARYLTQLKRAKLIDMKPYQIIILNKGGLEKILSS